MIDRAAIDRQRELAKLGRLLERTPARLDLDAAALRTVREALSGALFDAGRPALRRVASASKLLPNGTVARVGEQVFGPLLCARIVGLLPPNRARDLALRMQDEFLADTSSQLDPREGRQLVASLPTERVVAVAGVLAARNDFVTLARFVDYLSLSTIEAVIESIPDEVALFRIATYVESTARVAELLGLLPRKRLSAMLAAIGARGGELWLEALILTSELDVDWKQRLGDLAAELDSSVLEAMVLAARQFAAWELVWPLVEAMSEWSQRRFFGVVESLLVRERERDPVAP